MKESDGQETLMTTDCGCEPDELVEGEVYLMRMYDCCICGEFTSRLTRKKIGYDDGSDDTAIDSLSFENGVVLSDFTGCSFFVGEEQAGGPGSL